MKRFTNNENDLWENYTCLYMQLAYLGVRLFYNVISHGFLIRENKYLPTSSFYKFLDSTSKFINHGGNCY